VFRRHRGGEKLAEHVASWRLLYRVSCNVKRASDQNIHHETGRSVKLVFARCNPLAVRLNNLLDGVLRRNYNPLLLSCRHPSLTANSIAGSSIELIYGSHDEFGKR